MKYKTMIQLIPSGQQYDGDRVSLCGDNIWIYDGCTFVAMIDNSRKRIHGAVVVREKKKKWRLKWVKE